MDSKTILEKLSDKSAISQTYEVFPVENSSCYFGKDNDNNIVFMIPSKMPKVAPIYQETKSLRFAFNKNVRSEVMRKKKRKLFIFLLVRKKTRIRFWLSFVLQEHLLRGKEIMINYTYQSSFHPYLLFLIENGKCQRLNFRGYMQNCM